MKGSTLAIAGGLGVGLLLISGAGKSRTTVRSAPPKPTNTGATPKKKTRGKNLPQVGLDLAAARAEAPKVSTNIITRGYDYDSALIATFQGHAGLAADGVYGPQTRSALRYFGISDPPGALFKGTAKEYAPPSGPPAAPRALSADFPPLPSAPFGHGGSSGGGGATGSWDEDDAGAVDAGGARTMSSARLAAQLAATGAGTPGAQEDDAPPQEREPVTSAPTPSNLDLARREAPKLAKHIALKRQNYSRQAVGDFQRHAGLVPDGYYGPVTRSALEYFGVSNAPPALAKSKNPSATYRPPS